MTKIIEDKIEELRLVLEQELPNTVVMFEITFTANSIAQSVTHKHPDQLKKESISMRNIKGEWIK